MEQLHVVFLPIMAHGHMIPTLDMAKLFASRGLKTTIISTPSFADPIKTAQKSGHNICLTIIKFPPENSSLPENITSLDQISTPDLISKFIQELASLQEPVEKILLELNPNCLISDMLLPWTNNSAAKFGIPRLVFHGTSCFALCTSEQMYLHKPYKNVLSEREPFVVPNLPNKVTFIRTQVPQFQLDEDDSEFSKLMQQVRESDEKSYGVIFNSFHELESSYVDFYKNVMNRKAWHVGPLLSCKDGGERANIDEHECLTWLDSKRPNSVVYVCFGSMVTFSPAQLRETALGLEASGHDFIWVVRRSKSEDEKNEDWLPHGFEQRTKNTGMIIRGWAPQVMFLGHRATGAFATHCGWNSTLEGICAGVPMVTWPVFAEQFYNEKLVTEVLGIGVAVGSEKWAIASSEGVGREAVRAAVQGVMVGEGAEDMRRRAEGYKEMARKAVGKGGSSYDGLSDLIEELSVYVYHKKQDIINIK